MINLYSKISKNKNVFIDELIHFLSYKSISTDEKYNKDVNDCANYLTSHLTEIGLENVKLHKTKGHPIIYAEWIHKPDQPTILFYGHYDVQPVDPVELWDNPPFSPVIKDGRLYARGVSDDKGQVFCHLKAIETMLKTFGELPVNVKVLIEGEEEIGSPNLEHFLIENRDLLSSDIALVSDTPMFSADVPTICTSLRGLVYLEFSIKTGTTDLHSGQQGGTVPNAIHVATDIISQLKDADNRVLIPHFYDDVVDISDEIKKNLAALPFDKAYFLKEAGVKDSVGEAGYNEMERRWYRPTLDINGIYGGYTGEGAKTVVPCQCTVKMSMRLVSNQMPREITDNAITFIETLCPDYADITFKKFTEAKPATVNYSHPAVKAGLDALEKAFNKTPLIQGEGGSIPVVSDFKDILGIETVLMGFNLPDDCIHAPNERFSIDHYIAGIKASTSFFMNLMR